MKKYLIMLFLIVGFSAVTFAQNRRESSGPTKTTKHKARKQMFHFDKEGKDKMVAHNGTSTRKADVYKVDKRSFISTKPVRDNRKFMSQAASERKGYQQKLKRTIFLVRKPRSRFAV